MVTVFKENHGIDGWDYKSWPVATFDNYEMAQKALSDLDYGIKERDSFYHNDWDKRHCMGAISYKIKENTNRLPHNVLP